MEMRFGSKPGRWRGAGIWRRAETYQGITGAGQRVFSFNVQGKEIKDFDIWAKAGGRNRAYIKTVPVGVTDGEFRIVFTRQVENPAINAIELVPQAEAEAGAPSSVAAIRIKAGLSTAFTDSSGQVWQPDAGFEGGMTSQVGGGPPRDQGPPPDRPNQRPNTPTPEQRLVIDE